MQVMQHSMERLLFTKELNCNKAKKLMELVKNALSLMKIFSIECCEEEVIITAEKLQFNFLRCFLCFFMLKKWI
jgi:hypothetical protein